LAASRPGRRRRPAPQAAPGEARDPTPFGAAIRELLAARGWEQTERVAAVMGRWEQIVGPDIAAHCRPESLHEGELVLVAESTAWATQLRLLTRTMLQRLAAELGPGLVTKVRVHGPTAPSWQKGPRRVTGGRGPRDTYG
jgi:predicted nucleic acid-binding Zn ribbon protein